MSFLVLGIALAVGVAAFGAATHHAPPRLTPSSLVTTTIPVTQGSAPAQTSMPLTTTSVGSTSISAAQARNFVGQYETVKFNVGYTYVDSNGTEFLDQYQNYQSGFVVTIFSEYLSGFSFDPATTCLSQTVEVSGYVSVYNGFVEILNPASIRVL